MRFLRVLRAVLWSIFGVRRRGDAQRDLEGTPPAILIGTALLVALLLVGTLAALAHFVLPDRTPRDAAPERAASLAPRLHGPVVAADTIEERVRPCTTCHGAETQATRDGFSPRIAGKPAGYLFNQLTSFRDGRRTYAPMVYLVQYMTDDYLREIANYFAALQLPYPASETPAAT